MSQVFGGSGASIKQLSRALGAGEPTNYPVSMFAWFNSSSLAAYSNFLTIGDATGANYANIQFSTSGRLIQETQITGTQRDMTNGNATAITVNTWHAVAGVWNSAVLRDCYVDGVAQGETSPTMTMAAPWTQLQIGALMSGGTTYPAANSTLAFVAFWNVALAQADINLLGTGISPRRVQPASLFSYFRFSGPIGTATIPDLISGTPFTVSSSAPTQGSNPAIYIP